MTPLFYDFLTTLHGMIVYGMIVHGVFIHGMIYTGMDIVRLIRHCWVTLITVLDFPLKHGTGVRLDWIMGTVICKSLLSKTQLKI